MKCPECQWENREEAPLCAKCGFPLNDGHPAYFHSDTAMKVTEEMGGGLHEEQAPGESAGQVPVPDMDSSYPGREVGIMPRTRVLVFCGIFYLLLVAYLLVVLFFPRAGISQASALFDAFWANFLFFVLALVVITLALYGLFCLLCEEFLKSKWYHPRLGKLSVREGYITKTQLKEVLDEQELRIGEVLLNAGRITNAQLEEALADQKKTFARLGDVLKRKGYATEEDIYWALGKTQRKLGEIMVERGLLSEGDVVWLLNQQKRGSLYI